MQTYNNLPGVIINELDGGLDTSFSPSNDAVLILGTAGQGVTSTAYQVQSTAATAAQFGFNGSLFRAVAEAATYSDNVLAYRIGTTAMQLHGVGADTTPGSPTPGFDIHFSDVTADAATRYKIWYAANVLAVWKDGNLQFSNQANAAVDTGDISISSTLGLSGSAAVAGNIGLSIGTGATRALLVQSLSPQLRPKWVQ